MLKSLLRVCIYVFVRQVKAWTIRKGYKAPQAAGCIHTDFEKSGCTAARCRVRAALTAAAAAAASKRGFICAEVMSYKDWDECGSEVRIVFCCLFAVRWWSADAAHGRPSVGPRASTCRRAATMLCWTATLSSSRHVVHTRTMWRVVAVCSLALPFVPLAVHSSTRMWSCTLSYRLAPLIALLRCVCVRSGGGAKKK